MMTLRLATAPIAMTHGNVTVLLRPSLRAGFRIAEKYTLAELRKGIEEFNFTMICSLAAIGADDPTKALRFLSERLADREGIPRLQAYTPAFINFVSQSLGLSAGTEQPADNEEPATEPDLITQLTALFEVGTGWLGWSPGDTWAATPAEIMAAQRGLFAKLKAIHGSADDKPASDPRNVPDAAQVKANVAALKQKFGSKL